jgi:hypothetical protein
MKILFWNTQLFPTDSAIITYHPEDESSGERALIIRDRLRAFPEVFDTIALLGCWGYSWVYLVFPANSHVTDIGPTKGKVKLPKPILPALKQKDPREPEDRTVLGEGPRQSTPAERDAALKKDMKDVAKDPGKVNHERQKALERQMAMSNEPGKSLDVTDAGNGMYIVSKHKLSGPPKIDTFDASEGADKHAAKGVVALNTITTAGHMFLHLQDSYASENEFENVRKSQLKQAVDVYHSAGIAGGLVFGELNVRADRDRSAGNNEWATLFANPSPDNPVKDFKDGWSYMIPPDVNGADMDQGNNAIDRALNRESRLSYALIPDHSELVPYHIRMPTALRHGSNRYGVVVEFGPMRPHCTPSASIVVDFSSSDAFVTNVEFDADTGPRWLLVPKEGTYSIMTANPRFKVEVYSLQNLSSALSEEGPASISGSAWEGVIADMLGNHDNSGVVYESTQPFLIRLGLKQQYAQFVGSQRIVVLRHDGGTRGTAITIKPNVGNKELSFPAGRPLPPTDTKWLRLPAPKTIGGVAMDGTLEFTKNSGEQMKLLLDNDVQSSVGGTEVLYSLPTKCPSGEALYAQVSRGSLGVIGFAVGWRCNVSFLRLDKPVTLSIDDETGPDWYGDDEATIWLAHEQADGYVGTSSFLAEADANFFEVTFPDADTGDKYDIGNNGKLHDAVKAKTGQSNSIAFVDHLTVRVFEDDFDEDLAVSHRLAALPAGENQVHEKSLSLPIQSGSYSLKYTLSRMEQLGK